MSRLNGLFAGRRRCDVVIGFNQDLFHETEQHQAVIDHQDFGIALLAARFLGRGGVELIGAADRFHEQLLPIHLDRSRTGGRIRNFGNGPAFPTNDLIERRHSLSSGSSRMADLSFLKKHPRLFAAGPGKLHHCSRAAHAFELDDVSELKIPQRSLKFFRGCSIRGMQ